MPEGGPAFAVEEIRTRLGLSMNEMAAELGLTRQSYSIAINTGRVNRVLELAIEGLLRRHERGREFAFVVRVADRMPSITLVRRPRAPNGDAASVPDMTFLVNFRGGEPMVRPLGALLSIILDGKEHFLLPAELLGTPTRHPHRTEGSEAEAVPVPLASVPVTHRANVLQRDKHSDSTPSKKFLVINDVLGLLAGRAQLRVAEILDGLERAGIIWFDMTLPRARRLDQLRSILYSDSRQAEARVKRTHSGFYQMVQEPADSGDEPPEAVKSPEATL
jgi:hypothetical protein